MALEQRPALGLVTVKPGEWCTTWDSRPDREVAFGLRLPSDEQESEIRKESGARVREMFGGSGDTDGAIDEWNATAMALYVGACICDPNDYRNDPEQIHHPQDTVRLALRSDTILRLYHAIERLKIEQSPASIDATDNEVVVLGDLLLDGLPDWLTPAQQARVRRHVAYILDELTGD